jgi:predicted CoA-binding protein
MDGKVVSRPIGRSPEQADLVYSYRPLSELPGIIATAKTLQAKIIWTQSGRSAAGTKDPKGCWLPEDELNSVRALVHSAGLNHVSQPYIAGALREIRALPPSSSGADI